MRVSDDAMQLRRRVASFEEHPNNGRLMSAVQQEEFQVRGYMILNVAGYLRDTVGEAEAKRIFDALSPKVA